MRYFYLLLMSFFTVLSSSSFAGDEVVIYANQINNAQIFGRWVKESDASAAQGTKLRLPNLAEAKIDPALAAPANYFEVSFQADAGKLYHVWFRIQAESNYYGNDSVSAQFSDSLDAAGVPNYRIGTTQALAMILEEGNGAGLSGWGWNDNHYGSFGAHIQFANSGTHTLRVQGREDGSSIDQIVISASKYFTTSPGSFKNDATIVPLPSITPPPTRVAELPRVYLDTTYTPPTGKTINVPAGGDLQTAINNAVLGDEIVLQAGATYTGSFKLPNKTGSGWIYIRTSELTQLPAGKRVSPADNIWMPKILSPGSNLPCISTAPEAHHYRIMGIEFGKASPSATVGELIRLGENTTLQNTLASVPHDIILDRIYAHGDPTSALKRGIGLNSARSSVIDSYISDCHVIGQDSQAIAGFNGPGPFKIANCYLEASTENVLFGGDDSKIPNLIPSDIEFRNNHLYKPLSWKVGHPTYAGYEWSVKNLFELKSAQRVLIEGNLMEHSWVHSQVGYAILFNTTNQGGTAPWSAVMDVTLRNNIIRRSSSAICSQGNDYHYPASEGRTRRIVIENNLFEEIGGTWGGSGRWIQLSGGTSEPGPEYVHAMHNTVFQTGDIMSLDSYFSATGIYSIKPGCVFKDNIVSHGLYGVKGQNTGIGNTSIKAYLPECIYTANVMVNGPSSAYSSYTGNFFPSNWTQVSFVNSEERNYRLASTSPYKGKSTDGKDIGVDMDTLLAAMDGGIANTPPVAINQSLTTSEDTAVGVTLAATDAENDPLSYQVVTAPTHGTLSGTAPNLTYKPHSNYFGTDQFTFKATDGKADSNTATVQLSVVSQNDIPTIGTFSVSPNPVLKGQTASLSAGASDEDGDSLSYFWNFGDGASAAGANTTHIYASAGTYVVQVTVDDSKGGLVTKSASLVVNELPVVNLSSSDRYGTEATDHAEFTISRTGDLSCALTVPYLLGGTALSGQDYQPVSGSVTIPAGQSSIKVPILLLDDSLVEGLETISVRVPVNPAYTLKSYKIAIYVYDDETPLLSIAYLVKNTVEGSAEPAKVVITRLGPSSSTINVSYNLRGSATIGVDYISPGAITIPAGMKSITVPVSSMHDIGDEPNESIVLTMLSATGYQVSRANQVSLGIIDND